MFRAIRDKVKPHEVWVALATAILGVYLAGGNVLRGAKWPNENVWMPWTGWFIALLVAAVYVPLYALYKALDARLAEQDKQAAEAAQAQTLIDKDLELVCQRAAAAIAEHCPQVNLNDLATQVWLCRDGGKFADRRYRFYLPHDRKRSGVVWKRGKGVAGVAWSTGENLAVDLRELQGMRERLGREDFDALPPATRYGMSYAEVGETDTYTGIVAIRLFSTDPQPKLRAIFIIDYTGANAFDCVKDASRGRDISVLLGGCEDVLTSSATLADNG